MYSLPDGLMATLQKNPLNTMAEHLQPYRERFRHVWFFDLWIWEPGLRLFFPGAVLSLSEFVMHVTYVIYTENANYFMRNNSVAKVCRKL